MYCNPVQGQYRARTGFSLCSKFSQGKTCFYYREPLFSLQGIPCENYYTGRSLKSLQGMGLQCICAFTIMKQKYFVKIQMHKN